MHQSDWEGKEIISIYFGGGTPSLIDPSAISALLQRFSFSSSCEITLEANPDSLTQEKIAGYLEAGINRFSIGIQSLDEKQLALLNREHTAAQAREALLLLHRENATNISIDLMYDLPSQTVESWQTTLDQIAALPITHLSLYNLTFEPRSLFYKQRNSLSSNLPSPVESEQMLTAAIHSFELLGFSRYEISAFAKPGFQSIHNSGYWTGRPFLGFGPSAFSYWEKRRFSKVSHIGKYCRSLAKGEIPIDFTEELPYPDRLHELLAVELRLLRGVNLEEFEKREGTLPLATHQKLKALVDQEYLQKENSTLKLSAKGALFYDTVATEII